MAMHADEAQSPSSELLVAPLGCLVRPPRDDRVRHLLRTRDDAGALALVDRADVYDQELRIGGRLLRRIADDARARLREQGLYPRRNCGSTFSPKSRICSCRSAPHSSSMTCVHPASRYSSIAAMHSSGVPAIGLQRSSSASVTCSFAASRPPRSIASATGASSSISISADSSSASAAPLMFWNLFARYMPQISRAPSRPASRSDSWIDAITVQPMSIVSGSRPASRTLPIVQRT